MFRHLLLGGILLSSALFRGTPAGAQATSSPLGDLLGAAGLDETGGPRPAPDPIDPPRMALPGGASTSIGEVRYPKLHAMSLANSLIRSIPIYRYPEARERVVEDIDEVNPTAAAAALRDVVTLDPEYAPAQAVLAILLERYWRGTDEPAALLDSARKLAPDSEVVRAADLEYILLRGDTQRCLQGCLKFIEETPSGDTPVWPHELITHCRVAEQNPAETLNAVDDLLELDADNTVAILSLASYVRFTGNLEEAIGRYEIIVRTSRDPIARNNLAYLYTSTGRHRAALDILEPLASEFPQSVPVQDSLALVYLRLGEREKALALLDTLIEQAPRFGPAHLHRALALAELGRIDEARESLRRAVITDPQSLEEAEVREARRKIPQA